MNATAPGPVAVPQVPSKQSGEIKPKSKNKSKEKSLRDSRPARVLPSERIAFDKQLDILRAFAAASAQGTKPVTLDEVAAIVKMVPSTVAMGNPFFISIGMISKTDAGYLPATDVINFLRAFEWNRETASFKLAPTVESTWFYQALSARLSFDSMDESSAIAVLAESSSAGPDYKKNLQILIEYMIVAGLVQRDGSVLRLVRQAVPSGDGTARQETGKTVDPPPETQPKARILTGFAQTAEGAVHFNVQVRVEMAEFAGWKPERITAFFSGIAEVLKAKANVEKEVGN